MHTKHDIISRKVSRIWQEFLQETLLAGNEKFNKYNFPAWILQFFQLLEITKF